MTSLREEYEKYRQTVDAWIRTNPGWYVQENHSDGTIYAHNIRTNLMRKLHYNGKRLEEISDIYDDMTIADVESTLKRCGIPRITIRLGDTITVAAEGGPSRVEKTGSTLSEALNKVCLAFEHLPPPTPSSLPYEQRRALILRSVVPQHVDDALAALDREFGR